MRKIKKGDMVKVTVGKDAGKTGKVVHVAISPERRRATVEGVNMVVKHMRPRREGEKGQRVQFPAALSLSNLVLVCPSCSVPTRVGFASQDDGSKMRQCKQCNATFS